MNNTSGIYIGQYRRSCIFWCAIKSPLGGGLWGQVGEGRNNKPGTWPWLFYDPDLTAGGEVVAGELLLAAGATVSGVGAGELLPS